MQREFLRVRTTHSATGSLQAGTGAQEKGRPGRGSEFAMVSAGSLAGGRREPATAAMGGSCAQARDSQ